MSKRIDALTSMLLTAPVFLVYHLGVLLIGYRNGVDWVTGATFELVEWSVPAYIGVTLAVVAAFSLYCYLVNHDKKLQKPLFGPVVFESLLWALVMLFGLGWASTEIERQWLALSTAFPPSPMDMGTVDKIVMAAGAGFHEEAVFRLLILGGVFRYLKSRKIKPAVSLLIACLLSALLFAGAHHLGPIGEPLTLSVFLFRVMAGLFLGIVYVLRGFAIAVYTHTLYDILVFFVFG